MFVCIYFACVRYPFTIPCVDAMHTGGKGTHAEGGCNGSEASGKPLFKITLSCQNSTILPQYVQVEVKSIGVRHKCPELQTL
jgi:hypothetical protein